MANKIQKICLEYYRGKKIRGEPLIWMPSQSSLFSFFTPKPGSANAAKAAAGPAKRSVPKTKPPPAKPAAAKPVPSRKRSPKPAVVEKQQSQAQRRRLEAVATTAAPEVPAEETAPRRARKRSRAIAVSDDEDDEIVVPGGGGSGLKSGSESEFEMDLEAEGEEDDDDEEEWASSASDASLKPARKTSKGKGGKKQRASVVSPPARKAARVSRPPVKPSHASEPFTGTLDRFGATSTETIVPPAHRPELLVRPTEDDDGYHGA